ncbi:hypothetical protein [Actinomadura macrotermitis]|uniref:HEAT repeat domain-containing protein n=1 Tax=Actinomadura macrotermitis TaxID=2585200 RepID=A0A7K0C0J0_9ACTN|nr:hypothetical protein [Actinomadura macrotermitis]MQY06985.1 hypothetical protein [Actinomadura macrotermitis]
MVEVSSSGDAFRLDLSEGELDLVLSSLLNTMTGSSDEELSMFVGWTRDEIGAFLHAVLDRRDALAEARRLAALEEDGKLASARSEVGRLRTEGVSALVAAFSAIASRRGEALQEQDGESAALLGVQLEEIAAALGGRRDLLLPLLGAADPGVRLAAAMALTGDHPEAAVPVLQELAALPPMTADFITQAAARLLRARKAEDPGQG